MKVSLNKYFILAIIGAIILGIGLYLLLNNYFEKVEIIVAQTALAKDKVIEEKDILKVQYYKNSLPEGYITEASDVIGRVLLVERKPKDPITDEVFIESTEENLLQALKETEALIALNINYVEPVVDELVIGSRISLVSTEKDKDLLIFQGQKLQFSYSGIPPDNTSGENPYTENDTSNANPDKKETQADAGFDAGIEDNSEANNSGDGQLKQGMIEGTLLEASSFLFSENIMVIDGQFLIKNLEIVNICRPANKESRALAGKTSADNVYIFLKCNINEAPVISRITKDNNYKIILERS